MQTVTVLLKASLSMYLVSTFIYAMSVWVRRVHIARFAAGVLFVSFGIHTLYIILKWTNLGMAPIHTPHDALSLFSWAVTGIYLLFQLKTKTRVLGVFVSPIALVFIIFASHTVPDTFEVPERLRSTVVAVHVLLTITGEAFFTLASLAGLMYLIQDKLLKSRRSRPWIGYLPSLHELDRINGICLSGGFPLLTLGLVTGSLWAKVVWGNPWPVDAKFIWALGVWVIYAFLLHQRLAIGWRGRRMALISLLAFLVVTITLVVEKVFFTTMHRFF
ncbi:MAG: cytochrome c biogenesis protein [Syntrophales bacterium]|nr:cytochrome c biogenesis protein [Syntrophales bacterium]